MFKVRIVGEQKFHAFDSQDEVFDWARKNLEAGTMFALFSYSRGGSLESMDRFTWTGRRMVMENINS